MIIRLMIHSLVVLGIHHLMNLIGPTNIIWSILISGNMFWFDDYDIWFNKWKKL